MCGDGDVGVPLSIRNVHLAIVVISRRMRQLPVPFLTPLNACALWLFSTMLPKARDFTFPSRAHMMCPDDDEWL